MHFPTLGEYIDALQLDLDAVLVDPVLRTGFVVTRAPGRLAVHGGTCAYTFEVQTPRGRYALRAFHRAPDALDLRYSAIERHLLTVRCPGLVDVAYQPFGITTDTGAYPVVRMPWIEGQHLAAFVADHRYEPATLAQLQQSLRRLARDLKACGVAHGDVQPTNVVVGIDRRLRLVDYDGLFVPDLEPLTSVELGHRNFQHPARRSEHFDGSLDDFSFIVLDLALEALQQRPDLWDVTSSREDAILFRADDYADPAASRIFDLLARLRGLETPVQNLAAVCDAPFEHVPRFEDFLAGKEIPRSPTRQAVGRQRRGRPAFRPARVIVPARDFVEVCKHVGDPIELVGEVVNVVSEKGGSDAAPCICIEFDGPGRDMACLRIWPEALARLDAIPDHGWAGQWVSAVGLVEPVVSVGRGDNRNKDVSISVTDAFQLQRLTEAEAHYRLGPQDRPEASAEARANWARTDPVLDEPVPGPAPSRIHDEDLPRRPVRPAPTDRITSTLPSGKPRYRIDPAVGTWRIAAVAAGLLALAVGGAIWLGKHSNPPAALPAAIVAPVEAVPTSPPAIPTAMAPAPKPEAAPVRLLSHAPIEPGTRLLQGEAGLLEIVDGAAAGCPMLLQLDGRRVQGSCERSIEFRHRATYTNREVVVGFARCVGSEPACEHDTPFWVELAPGEEPLLRRMPGVWVGTGQADVSVTNDGVRVSLGTWDGERRTARLSGSGNLYIDRKVAERRPLTRRDCAVVIRALESCAAVRDCSSFASSSRRIPATQRKELTRLYHETTGFDAQAFRALCVRSCELALTPSAGFIRRNACNGAAENQWLAGPPWPAGAPAELASR